MTPEDEEFNRIEMESRIRQETVRAALQKMHDDDPNGIPFVTKEQLEQLLKDLHD